MRAAERRRHRTSRPCPRRSRTRRRGARWCAASTATQRSTPSRVGSAYAQRTPKRSARRRDELERRARIAPRRSLRAASRSASPATLRDDDAWLRAAARPRTPRARASTRIAMHGAAAVRRAGRASSVRPLDARVADVDEQRHQPLRTLTSPAHDAGALAARRLDRAARRRHRCRVRCRRRAPPRRRAARRGRAGSRPRAIRCDTARSRCSRIIREQLGELVDQARPRARRAAAASRPSAVLRSIAPRGQSLSDGSELGRQRDVEADAGDDVQRRPAPPPRARAGCRRACARRTRDRSAT